MPPIRFSRECATIVRTERRRASHPVFGETVYLRTSADRHTDFLTGRKSRSSDFRVILRPAFPTLPGQWQFWGLRRPLQRRNRPGFTPGSLFSCGRSHRHSFKTGGPLYFVDLFKELHKMLRFSPGLSSIHLQTREVPKFLALASYTTAASRRPRAAFLEPP
jgi:hypothetical protein